MTSRLDHFSRLALATLVACTVALSGCGGGGGGGGGGADGVLIAVSFVGFPTQPLTGANPGVPLPTLFRDEVLEFRFDGPIDPGIMGGFLADAAGAPIVFVGLAPNSTGEVEYFAFREQSVARSAIEIRENAAGGALLSSYIVGVSVADASRLIVNPRVSASNSFGLPGSVGMDPAQEYTFRIPANSPITIGGNSVQPVGVSPLALPISVPAFSPAPGLSRVWFVGGAFSPDPEPPTIVSITSATPAMGTISDPISPTSAIEVTFSKVIDTTSIDPVRNFLVLNLSILTNGQPTLVPGQIDFREQDNRTILSFQPSPSFGPGVNSTTGYQIRVRVGRETGTTGIFGQPNGNPPVQLEVPLPLERLFVTSPCPTCVGATALTETFANASRKDNSVVAPLNELLWAAAGVPGLFAPAISGGPLAGFPASPPPPNLIGTRVQTTVTPSPLATPGGLFSPFDDATTNLGATVNPNGGSHIMHIYEGVDLGSRTDSLELVEWGPVNNIAAAPGSPTITNDYPSYQAWCGQTNTPAPIGGGGGNGLNLAYGSNYNLPTLQAPDPNGFGGVAVSGGPSTYTIPITTFRNFYPFPVFVQPFDYQGAMSQTHLLLEQNIEPGMQTVNFNRFRATAAFPIRRAIGAPLSLQTVGGQTPVAQAGGFDIYNMRFTFVKLAGTAQSQFYDTGLPNPDLLDIAIAPSPAQQPAGTSAVWEFQGAQAISPTVLGATPWLTYWSGTPATGAFQTSAINQLDGRRFLRFRVALRSNHLTNQRQAYTSVLFALAFTAP